VTVPVLVRFRQIAARHRVSKTEELSLAAMRLHGNYQITQTFTSGELAEHKDFELIPAGESLYVAVSLIFANKIVELVSIKIRC
jgi:hypothetical protein